MKMIQTLCSIPSFTSITNLYHLFYIHNIKEVLVDKTSYKYVDSLFDIISKLKVDFNITEPVVRDYISVKSLKKYGIKSYLEDSNLKLKYDLMVVKRENFNWFLPLMHRTVFIFIENATNDDPVFYPYTKINDCFEGILYMNDFHSINFPTTRLSIYEQTYIRDKPFRFLKKVSSFAERLDWKVIVEIGSSRTYVKHDIDEINPTCCNDSHSTFFWCRTNCSVRAVDINPICETVLKTGYEEGYLQINGNLEVHIEDGISFLQDYEGKSIDLLFLDAWDIIPGTDYAEKHLEAYEKALHHLADNAMVVIDDTDIDNGGKGRLLLPRMIQDDWLILYKGRHTVLYRGNIEKLWCAS